MSTKAARAAAKANANTLRASRRFNRMLVVTVTALVLLAGTLTAANLAMAPRLNTASHVDSASGTPDFDVYSLRREDSRGDDGSKKPDNIRGETVTVTGSGSGSGKSTVVVSAPRIQEYVALPGDLAVVTLNDDNTNTLEIVSLSGDPTVLVPLPGAGTVENLHASRSKHLVGYSFTSKNISDGYWKTLYVYDLNTPSAAPRKVKGLDGKPISVFNLAFVPNTTSLVAQTDDHSMFLVNLAGAGTVTPLGLHAELRGFVPGTLKLIVADRKQNPTNDLTDHTQNSTISLSDGTNTPVNLPPGMRTATSYAGKTVLLNGDGRYAQVFSEYSAGKESSVITLTDVAGSKIAYQPAPAWSRILDFCVSPNEKYLAVETTAPDSLSDQYPRLPEFSPVRTELVDLATGESVRTLAGGFPSWCR